MSLLEKALQEKNYELAALCIVYGMLKVMYEGKKQRGAGAPKGNQNARKHGFYSQVLDEAQKLQLEEAREVEGIDEEIAILRVKLLSLINEHPERIDLQLVAASTIARLIRTRHSINSGRHKSLRDAITKVLAEVAVPMGVKSLIR